MLEDQISEQEEQTNPIITFPPPECRYESSTIFTNDRGQKIGITVRGMNQDAVERYTKELTEAEFELWAITPEEYRREHRKQQNEDRKRDKSEPPYPPENSPSPTDLTMSVDVLEAPDVDSKYLAFKFAFGPSLTLSSCHGYFFVNWDDTDLQATVSWVSGPSGSSVSLTLTGAGRTRFATARSGSTATARIVNVDAGDDGQASVCGISGVSYRLSGEGRTRNGRT